MRELCVSTDIRLGLYPKHPSIGVVIPAKQTAVRPTDCKICLFLVYIVYYIYYLILYN